jgi:hypothetical protein
MMENKGSQHFYNNRIYVNLGFNEFFPKAIILLRNFNFINLSVNT